MVNIPKPGLNTTLKARWPADWHFLDKNILLWTLYRFGLNINKTGMEEEFLMAGEQIPISFFLGKA